MIVTNGKKNTFENTHKQINKTMIIGNFSKKTSQNWKIKQKPENNEKKKKKIDVTKKYVS